MPLRPLRQLHGNGNVCLWLRRKNRVVPMFVLYAACYSELAAHQKICLHARVVQRSASRNEIGADFGVPVGELQTVARVKSVLAPPLPPLPFSSDPGADQVFLVVVKVVVDLLELHELPPSPFPRCLKNPPHPQIPLVPPP